MAATGPLDARLALEAPVGPRTLADRAFIELRDAIISVRLEPGQRLRLDEVAQQLGMSVMPVREALRRLEAAALIEVEPHRGATVSRLSSSELVEVFDLRRLIEVAAVRRAAGAFDDTDAAAARAALADYGSALLGESFGDVTESHVRFHLALYRADGQPWLVRSLMPLWETSSRYWNWVKRAGWQADNLLHAHERLLELCVAGEEDGAAAELDRHLLSGRDMLMAQVAAAVPAPAVV